jgi:hypothetical protein
MDEGRKRVIGIMAAILASLHMERADDLFGGPQGSPRTDKLIEDRGESERPTVMAGIRIATLSDAQAGRLPLGFRSRKNLANRPNRIGR